MQCGPSTHKTLIFSTQSLRVRSNYIDQLRVLRIIETHFIPNIFSILKLYDGIIKTFKLDIWAVEEYYVQRKSALVSCENIVTDTILQFTSRGSLQVCICWLLTSITEHFQSFRPSFVHGSLSARTSSYT